MPQPKLKVSKARGWARELERAGATRTPPSGYVSLFCDDPPLATMLLLGAASPKISGGVGGWDTVERPHQTSMTIWKGVDPFTLELAVMLDAHASEYSVEPTLRALYAVAGGDPEVEPGIVEVRGVPSLPVEQWVITTIDVDDNVIRRDKDFHRTRQPVTITLLEYVPPQYMQLRNRALTGDKSKTKTITVRKGDTPAKIARKHRCKWTDIRRLNKDTTPPKQPWKANSDLKDGSKVRVPVADKRERKAKGSLRSRKTKSKSKSK